jgi:pyruvate, water dikinase
MSTATPHAPVPPDLFPIRLFSELSIDDVPYAGGEGASLGRLTQTGLSVAPGFVVGAPAYGAFRIQSGLAERLQGLLGGLDVEDKAAVGEAAEQAQQAVEGSEIPDWLAGAIGDAYEGLVGRGGDAPVAVRSSATAGDTASASLVGMNETFPNTRGRDAVIDAVKRCWMSLFSAEAIYYRGHSGLSQADMDIAVVVQRQIDSTRAGVMFTIDSASGDQNHLVIEGAFGLGEALLPGQVSPDRYIVDKQRSAVVLRTVRSTELISETAPSGGTTTREPIDEESHRAVLSDDEVLRVAELGMAIEREYRAPQDTEWAFDQDGRVWMLHSRPIRDD